MRREEMKKEYEPFVSVIIPFYNVGEYARPCLQSLVEQKYNNCEFICVNDGSTDNTPEILKEFEDDKRIKVLHKDNGGLSSARNLGLDAAKGVFITFIDGDDFIHPNYLRILVNATEGHNDRVVISPIKLIKYKEPLDIKEGWNNNASYYILDKKTVFEKVLYDELSVSACGKLVPRTAYDDIRFPVGMVSEDVATIGSLLKKYNSYSITNQPLYGYVMRGDSIGHKKVLKYSEIQDRIDALKMLEETVRKEFVVENDSKLTRALQYRWAWAFVDMANMYGKVSDDKDAVNKTVIEVNDWLKNNIKKIVNNKSAPFAQRLRMWLYTFFPRFYCWLYSLYQRCRYNL